MDQFAEQLVVRKKQLVNSMLYVLYSVLMIVLGLVGVMSINYIFTNTGFNLLALVGTVVGAGGAVFLFFYKDQQKVEYEYAFTNGILDFAKVIANKKRKELLSIRLLDIEACNRTDHESYKRYAGMPDVKKINCALNPEQTQYYIYLVAGGVKQLVLFEPNAEMMDLIYKANPIRVRK